MNVFQKAIYFLDKRTNIFEYVETRRADWFEKFFKINNWFAYEDRVIDLGCGVGDITNKIVHLTKNKVVGIDIEDFRRVGNKTDCKFYFIRASLNDIPIRENSFETAIIFWTLHHLENPIISLTNAVNILKDKGQLIIVEDLIDRKNKFKSWFLKIYDRIINLEFFYHPHSNLTLEEWDELIKNNFNAEEIELKEFDYLTPFKLIKYGLLRYRINK